MPTLSTTDELELLKRLSLQNMQPLAWDMVLDLVDAKLECTSSLVMFNRAGRAISRFGGRLSENDLAMFLGGDQLDDRGGALQFLVNEAPLSFNYCKLAHDPETGAENIAQLPDQDRAASPVADVAPESELTEPYLMNLSQAPGFVAPVWRSDDRAILFAIVFVDRQTTPPSAAAIEESFNKIVHMLAEGLNTYFQLENARTENRIQSKFLSAIPSSAVLIDKNRRVLASTGDGLATLASTEAATSEKNRLIVKSKPLETIVQAMLEAGHAEAPKALSVCFEDPFGSLKRISLKMIEEEFDSETTPWVLLQISSPNHIAEDVEQVLQDHFDLSQSEARLARCLTLTGSMKATAELLGITRNTAKTHLRRIYEKTGINTQLKLAGLVHKLAGLF